MVSVLTLIGALVAGAVTLYVVAWCFVLVLNLVRGLSVAVTLRKRSMWRDHGLIGLALFCAFNPAWANVFLRDTPPKTGVR